MSTTHVKMAIESMLKQSTLLNHSSTITPAELLFHLHLVEDPKNENLQLRKSSAIATQICFENLVYNESVLGIVLQQLIDRPQTPKLFLRTVIESFKKFPKLTEYILNLLSKLITKQVWTDEALWKGFIIFCKVLFKLFLFVNCNLILTGVVIKDIKTKVVPTLITIGRETFYRCN